MIKRELAEVIENFEQALVKDELPNFNGNLHRVEQVLRILKVDYQNFTENEIARGGKYRSIWEGFAETHDRNF